MNNDILILENQITIMEALLCVTTVDSYRLNQLKAQIILTRERIRELSKPLK